jgi:hypothetical protein
MLSSGSSDALGQDAPETRFTPTHHLDEADSFALSMQLAPHPSRFDNLRSIPQAEGEQIECNEDRAK